jgi:hypothetical protein
MDSVNRERGQTGWPLRDVNHGEKLSGIWEPSGCFGMLAAFDGEEIPKSAEMLQVNWTLFALHTASWGNVRASNTAASTGNAQ